MPRAKPPPVVRDRETQIRTKPKILTPPLPPSSEIERLRESFFPSGKGSKSVDKEIMRYMRDKQGELHPRELLFVDYYTGTLQPKDNGKCVWNASDAARSAGYSAKSAGVAGHKLLARPAVIKLIRERLRDQLALARVTAAKTLRHFAAIAYQDAGVYFNEDGTLKQLRELSEDARLAVASFEIEEKFETSGDSDNMRLISTRIKKVKLWDKLKGLEAMRDALDKSGQELRVRHDHFVMGPDGGPLQHAHVHMTAEQAAQRYQELVRGEKEG